MHRLIAILLGRLRLSVPEAIDRYRVLAKQVFSERKYRVQDGTFKASKLEAAIKETIEWKLGEGKAETKMFMTNTVSGKTYMSFDAAIEAPNNTGFLDLCAQSQQDTSTSNQDSSGHGQRIKALVMTAPSGKPLARHLRLLYSSSVSSLEIRVSKRNPLMPLWDVTILCGISLKKPRRNSAFKDR